MNHPISQRSPLSCGQQALWYLNQLEPASTAYHLGICLKLDGPVDEPALVLAWADVVMAHPQLRTRFVLRAGKPCAITEPFAAPLKIERAGVEYIPRLWKEMAERPFILADEFPIRALLIRGENGDSHLMLCSHHIVMDLWSSAIILQDLSDFYEAYTSGRRPANAREKANYVDFITAERTWLDTTEGRAASNFWHNYLREIKTQPLFNRQIAAENSGSIPICITPNDADLIKQAARKRGTTPYSILLAGYAHLLADRPGQKEVLIGTAATLRNRAAFRQTVGYFVNAVPVRCPVAMNTSDALGAVATSAGMALKHRRFPFPVLVERLGIPRIPGTTPLFQSMFAYQSLPRANQSLLPLALNSVEDWQFSSGITATPVTMPAFDAQFPIALVLGPDGANFSGQLQYDGQRISVADAVQLSGRFVEVIRNLLVEKKSFVPGTVRPDKAERLEAIFSEAVARDPNAIAVSEAGVTLTYAELDARAEKLARALNALLPDCERPVALQMPSCAEALLLVLGILKSGRAFQPIDPDEPEIRRNTSLLQTSACALLSPRGINPGSIPDGVLALDSVKLEAVSGGEIRRNPSSRTAYLIYTSGTTGKPKAVEVEHTSVVNHARATATSFGLAPTDHVLQFHTLGFDAAFEEIFPSFVAGARIVFAPEIRSFAVPAFWESVKQNEISVLNLPTSYWHILTAETARLGLQIPSGLRLLIVGGEQASTKVYRAWRKLAPECRWINTYGPTEATITALTHEPHGQRSIRGTIPIGRPIDGVTAMILRKDGKPKKAGYGELLIGGKGLALGYHGDPETTAARFINVAIDGETQRFYRTGDRAKLRADGIFVYIGRMDRQLKIRGYRVDLDEIETILRSHQSIIDAVVIPWKTHGEPALAAWIVRGDTSLTDRRLCDYLATRLSHHMIPTHRIFVRRIPRKSSGKVDRLALHQLQRQASGCADPASNPVTALFSRLLGRKVESDDDFFLFGGHSLLAIKLLGLVETEFGVRIPLSDFVVVPTAQKIWERVRSSPQIKTAATQEAVPLETPVSSQQGRALLAHETEDPSLANIALILRIRGRIDETVMAQAIECVARQNVLVRVGFMQTARGIVMRETSTLPQLEHRFLPACQFDDAVLQLAHREANQPFPLDGQTPWLRWFLVSAEEATHRCLLLVSHHAVADGWAIELLLEDLREHYVRILNRSSGGDVPTRDYRAYALQQSRWMKSEAARHQLLFWKKRLSRMEQFRLPFRLPTAPRPSWRSECHEMTLSPKLSRSLQQVAASSGTTPFALMMACFKALIHRHTGHPDIVLGSMISNRYAASDQAVFGPLQNPVLIRDEVSPDETIRTLARRVTLSLVEAQSHGALPFDTIVREALAGFATGRETGIQFVSHDRTSRVLRLGSASLSPVEIGSDKNPFELSVAVSTTTERIRIGFEYLPAAYTGDGIRTVARQYEALLGSVVDNPDARVRKLNIIPRAELRVFDRRTSRHHFPKVELLQDGFERMVRQTPDALAVISDDRCLTYSQMHELSTLTACALVESGLKKQDLVAVMLPKGWQQIVACLAVLQAGGIYVPLEPTLPTARLEAIFGQGKFHTAIVLALGLPDKPWSRDLRSLITIHSRPKNKTLLSRPPLKPDATAYIIFTSGSTGIPKGVMVTHQAAMTTISEVNRRFQLCSKDRVFALSALGFDLSVFDIFGTLRAGGTIVVSSSRDPEEWLNQVMKNGVTVWNSVPCLFELLFDEIIARRTRPETLRLVMLSGDFISLGLARRARAELPCARLISLGGATEGAIWSIAREIEEVDPSWHRIPYGRPLRHQEMFVLDRSLNHCAAGVTGELFIAGAGLASGYWRNSSESRRRFLRHPLWKVRLYRTGDQGRYLPNGEIEILGRIDQQGKINGVRFEHGEIEAALCSLSSVRQALVEMRIHADGNKKLIAFVEAPGTTPDRILHQVKGILPAPLIPSVVVLDRLPLTTNGKVDRAALRMLDPADLPTVSAAAENPAEKWIADLWSSMLKKDVVGVDDDFFLLGGHSLLAIKMLQRVRSHFAVDLPLSLIVECPTVRRLAAAVNSTSSAKKTGLEQRSTADLDRESTAAFSISIQREARKNGGVFLTGATGHLGSALLAELLKKNKDPVYCLIRAGSKPDAEKRLWKIFQSLRVDENFFPRLIAVPGDLSRERCGLAADVYAELVANVRAIYHCAAEVNFIAPYEKLAPVNVGGVREMIQLAATANAILHHISSVAVFPYGQSQILREDEDISRIETLVGGYAQSKWAAERIVWKAISRGLRAAVYRPAQIVGRSDGTPQDLFEHALHVCKTLRAVPDVETRIDIVTADYAAAAIQSLSTKESSLGRAFHLAHPEPVPLRDFVSLFPSPLPLVPFDSWITSLNQEARRRDDASLHFVSMLAQGFNRTELTPGIFDCSATIAGLQGTGIVCPPLDRQFIRRKLNF